MKGSPGRKERRLIARRRNKKKGDLDRASHRKMRSQMGMKVAEKKSPEQKKVDTAVQDFFKDRKIPNRYYCTACRRYHMKKSKIGSQHTNFYLGKDSL